MGAVVELTLEQLAESILNLSEREQEELELLLMAKELKKRSQEVKKGEYLRLEEMESLRDV